MSYAHDPTITQAEPPMLLSLFERPAASESLGVNPESSDCETTCESSCDNCWTQCDCLSCYK